MKKLLCVLDSINNIMYMKGVTVSLSLLLDQILKINNYLRKISLLFRVAPPLKKISNMLIF